MNIFILSWNFKECAEYHFDKHVVKMILELAQILSTAHFIIDEEKANKLRPNIYKKTHQNHPCCKWIVEHLNNYIFTLKLAFALCDEYSFRYCKTHKTEAVLKFLEQNKPNYLLVDKEHLISDFQYSLIGPHKVTQPALAMPVNFKVHGDAITSYMLYYHSEKKKHIRSWKKRGAPEWFNEKIVIKSII